MPPTAYCRSLEALFSRKKASLPQFCGFSLVKSVFRPPVQGLSAPGFSIVGVGRIRTSHSSGSRLRLCCRRCPCPLRGPRKPLVPSRSHIMADLCRLRINGFQLKSGQHSLGLRPRRLRLKQGWRKLLIALHGYSNTTHSSLPPPKSLRKSARLIERHLLFQHVIARPRQFMCDSLDADYLIGFSRFALIKTSDTFIVSDSIMRRLNKRPG